MVVNTKVSVVRRKSTDIRHVGQISPSLSQTKLPSKGDGAASGVLIVWQKVKFLQD